MGKGKDKKSSSAPVWCPTGRGDGSHLSANELNLLKGAAARAAAEKAAQEGG